MANNNPSKIPNSLRNISGEFPYVAESVDIYDKNSHKNQEQINADTYRKGDIYTKEEIANILSRTPETDVIVLDVPEGGTAADALNAVPVADRPNKLFRVRNDDNTKYDEYGWTGSVWALLASKDYGIDDEPTESDNLVKGKGIYPLTEIGIICYNAEGMIDKNYNINNKSNLYKDVGGSVNNVNISGIFACYNTESGILDNDYNLYGIFKTTETVDYDRVSLQYLSNETVLEEAIGSMAGFPRAFVLGGNIYCFYSYYRQHNSIPGVENDILYYRYSTNGGNIWSARKELVMPRSTQIVDSSDKYGDHRNVYYDYACPVVTVHNNRAFAIGYFIPSKWYEPSEGESEGHWGICPYIPYYMELNIINGSDGDLEYSNYQQLPFVNDENGVVTISAPATPGAVLNSNVPHTNLVVVDNILYWCLYTSYRNTILLKWTTNSSDYPNENTIIALAIIGDNNERYSYNESAMFYCNGKLIMSIRDEYANVNRQWTYDIVNGTMEFIGNTKHRFAGPDILKVDGIPAILTGRRYDISHGNGLYVRDNFALVAPDNRILKEGLRIVGNDVGSDSFYCSSVLYNNTVFIFYYYGTTDSQVHVDSHYTLAYKTINKEDIILMLNN